MRTYLRPLALTSAVALAALGSACGVNDLRLGVPAKGDVSLNVPGANGDGQALLGETAEFYSATHDIARSVNGAVGAVFDLSERIINLPPTDTDGETYAVWGPSEPRGLERNSFRFTVNKIADGEFDYKLEARQKDATEEADFAVIWEGKSFPNGEGQGHGTLDIHWGALRSLDGESCLVGDLSVVYATDVEPKRVDVAFAEVADGCRDETPTNATYFYSENADASGQMDFAFQKNLHEQNEDKPLEEIFAVRSRWLADGTGRSDVRLSEGEIPADLAFYIPGTTATTADLVQCWDSSFAVTYQDTNPDELEPHLNNPEEGDVASCAFSDASFAEL
jgi:hypothetical protein